jgi:hypothetical protein
MSIQGERLKHLRETLGYPTPKAFSAALGIEFNRWNNIELKGPLSISVAMKVVNRFPGVTLDYLYFGKTDGLSVAMARRLGVLPGGTGKRDL